MTHKYIRARHASVSSDPIFSPDVVDLIASHVVTSDCKGAEGQANLASLRSAALGMSRVNKDFRRAYKQTETVFDGSQEVHELPFIGHGEGRSLVDFHPDQHFLLFYKGGYTLQELSPEVSQGTGTFDPASILFLRDLDTPGREVFVYLIESTMCRWRVGSRYEPNVCAHADQMQHFKGRKPDGYNACVACQLDTNEMIRTLCCRDAFSRMYESERFLAECFSQKTVKQSWLKSRDDDWLQLPVNNVCDNHTIHATIHTSASETGSHKVRKLSGNIGLCWNLNSQRAAVIEDDDMAVFTPELLIRCGMLATARELMHHSSVHPVDGYRIPRGLVPSNATYNERAAYVQEVVNRQPSANTTLTLFNPLRARVSAIECRKRSTLAVGMLNDTNSAGQLSLDHFTTELRQQQALTGLIDARFQQPGSVLKGHASDEGDDSDDEDYCPDTEQDVEQFLGEEDETDQGTSHNAVIPDVEPANHPVDYVSSDDEDVYQHGFVARRL